MELCHYLFWEHYKDSSYEHLHAIDDLKSNGWEFVSSSQYYGGACAPHLNTSFYAIGSISEVTGNDCIQLVAITTNIDTYCTITTKDLSSSLKEDFKLDSRPSDKGIASGVTKITNKRENIAIDISTLVTPSDTGKIGDLSEAIKYYLQNGLSEKIDPAINNEIEIDAIRKAKLKGLDDALNAKARQKHENSAANEQKSTHTEQSTEDAVTEDQAYVHHTSAYHM